MNIELKGPLDEYWIYQYDYNLAAQKVIEMIDAYDIGSKVMISSFNPVIMDAVIAQSPPTRKFIIHNLIWLEGESNPENYADFSQMTGTNIDYNFLTEERVHKMREEGK